MPMSIEKILEEAKKMEIGDRKKFVCDHVPTTKELQHLARQIGKHHKITPVVNWTGETNIIVNLVKPR